LVLVVCVAGIAGMIVSSIADNNGAAMTFGLVIAVAVLCLMVATSVTGEGRVAAESHLAVLSDQVEERVSSLVEHGAEEQQVRDLVRAAVKLGRLQP
jgi:hypothetical protein